jgi:hypothetical protein
MCVRLVLGEQQLQQQVQHSCVVGVIELWRPEWHGCAACELADVPYKLC